MSQDPTTNATKKIHLVIAQAGLASRRKAEQWVAEGRVHVNGAPASIGLRVTPSDTITVDGKPLPQATTHQTFLLYKPVGVVSTTNDEHGRTSVTQLLAQLEPSTAQKRFFPIGRLDMDAEGLIILTTDGAFAHQVSHPKFETKKTYHVRIDRPPTDAALAHFARGVKLDDRYAVPDAVQLLRKAPQGCWFEVVIHEGRYHQVKRMFQRIGYDVLQLIRVGVGPFGLADLKGKQVLEITDRSINESRV